MRLSTALKSEVKRFKILPTGTVSIQRKNLRKTACVSLLKMFEPPLMANDEMYSSLSVFATRVVLPTAKELDFVSIVNHEIER